MKKTWWCYIVQCSDNTLYCGISTDLQKRIKTHNSGKGSKYCRTRLPVHLKWFAEFENKSLASKEEWRIKRLSRIEKLKLVSSFVL